MQVKGFSREPTYIDIFLNFSTMIFLKVTWEHMSSTWQKISSKRSAQAHILTILP